MSSADPLSPLAALLRAASVANVQADALLSNLADVTGGFASAVAFTDANLQTFGIEVDLPDDEWIARRMLTLTSGITGSKALSRGAFARGGELRTGYASGPDGVGGSGLRGRMAILEHRGTASLAQDLEAVAAIGLLPAACEGITGRLRSLTGGDDGFRPRVVRTIGMTGPPNHDTIVELGAQTPGNVIDQLDEVAPAFELTTDQIRLLGTVQDILIAFDPPWVRIGAEPHAVLPGVTVAYGKQTAAHALRAVGKLSSRTDGIATFGAFLEALGNDIVETVELVVRPREPITARIGVALRQ